MSKPILVLNGGSSSIKFALSDADVKPLPGTKFRQPPRLPALHLQYGAVRLENESGDVH